MRGRYVRPRPERGQATVELALLLPLLVLLLLVILQIGLVGRDVVLVTHASREAARAAAIDPDPGAALEAARAAGGLDPERMTVQVGGRRDTGSRVEVTVTYRAATDVPLIGGLLGDHTIRGSTTMRVEGPVYAHPPNGQIRQSRG
jgi:Flp pilus assembly protein TadG